jgi:hypothetical protein
MMGFWRKPKPPAQTVFPVNALRPLKVVSVERFEDHIVVELDDGTKHRCSRGWERERLNRLFPEE